MVDDRNADRPGKGPDDIQEGGPIAGVSIARECADDDKSTSLGSSYEHARKAYGLTAGLLIAWELVGIDISTVPVESLNLTLKSPQAAPYVLIALLAYFAFRLTIEWRQAPRSSRRSAASRADVLVAHGIAGAAVALYVFQLLAKQQLADRLGLGLSGTLGFGIGAAIATNFILWREVVEKTTGWRRPVFRLLVIGTMIFAIVELVRNVAASGFLELYVALAMAALGIAPWLALVLWRRRAVRRWAARSSIP